jgi:hypothetical protein
MTPVSIKGPIESIDGQLALLIPLQMGGDELAKCARGIGEVEGDFLKIIILPWLAEKLGLSEGSLVRVDNDGGKFNIQPIGDPE